MANGDVFVDPALERRRQLALSIINRQGVQPQSLGSLAANLGTSFLAKRNLSRVEREQQKKNQRLIEALNNAGLFGDQQPPAQGIPVDQSAGPPQVNGAPGQLPGTGAATPGFNPLARAMSGVQGPQPVNTQSISDIAAINPRLALQLGLSQRGQQSQIAQEQRKFSRDLALANVRAGTSGGVVKVVPGVGLVRASKTGGKAEILLKQPSLADQLKDLGVGSGFEFAGAEFGPRGPTLKVQRKATKGEEIARGLSPGQKKVDEKFAGEFVDFRASGGFANVEKDLGQLDQSLEALRTNPELTGAVVGRLPDAVLSVTNPEALRVKQDIELIVTRSLRQTLGAQFTENEGRQLLRRTFDPTLSEEINAQRLEALVGQIRTMAQAKTEASDYFQANGTLKGFKGKIFNKSDIINFALPKKGSKKKSSPVAAGEALSAKEQEELNRLRGTTGGGI